MTSAQHEALIHPRHVTEGSFALFKKISDLIGRTVTPMALEEQNYTWTEQA